MQGAINHDPTEFMIDLITGVVLAGGRSTRMGRDKALLPYGGKNLIDAPIEILHSIFSTVVLSVKNSADYSDYSLQKIEDRYAEIGPIGGITSVLQSGVKRAFFVACDMPFLNPELIEFLCTFQEEAVIPIWDSRPEVLHSIYSVSVLRHLKEAITQKRYKITDALKEASIRYVEEKEIRRFDATGKSFRNVNTPSDYEMI
jgi:molybdopterin-guanine dinucleotide biosynthesis protein A